MKSHFSIRSDDAIFIFPIRRARERNNAFAANIDEKGERAVFTETQNNHICSDEAQKKI